MKPFLKEIIADPVTGSELVFDEQIGKFINQSNRASYELRDQVPVLLPRRYHNTPNTSPLHQDTQTTFDYIDHYQKDAEFFDYFKEPVSREEEHEERRLHEAILNQLLPETKRVLDVGCGNGWVAKTLCSRSIQVISMDVSTKNPLKVLSQLPDEHHAALVGDIYHLPLQENSVDTVIASEIMEHTPDPRLFIEQLLKVVRPGGQIIITTPYNERIKYHLCVHCNHPTPSYAHLHSFSETNFKQFLPEENLSWQYEIFSNRYLHKIRSHLFLRALSFRNWQRIDALANRLLFKPSRFLVTIEV